MKTVSVRDFTEFPGPRYEYLGPCSGEEFRKNFLLPAINEYGSQIQIDLDGTMGYGSSFLEESFGGLVRAGVDEAILLELIAHIVSNEDPSLIEEIGTYIRDEIINKKKKMIAN